MGNFPEREHGLPDMGDPTVPPVVKRITDIDGVKAECPNCGSDFICEITVPINNTLLTAGKGIGTYLGCPACPWASPMACVSHGARPPNPDNN